MEEGFVLDGRESWVVQKVAEHECSWLSLFETASQFGNLILAKITHRILLLGSCHVSLSSSIFQRFDLVVTSFCIKLTLHEYIEKESYGGVVTKMGAQINSPE